MPATTGFVLTSAGHALLPALPWESTAVRGYSVGELAHALACINRHTGHAARPFSTAEHSLLVCDVMHRSMGITHVGALMAGLMSAAHEVLLGHVGQAVRGAASRAVWEAMEGPCRNAVLESHGLWRYWCSFVALINRADHTALATQRRDLFTPLQPVWPEVADVPPLADINLMDQRAEFTWRDWRTAFEDRFQELDYCRRSGITHLEALRT